MSPLLVDNKKQGIKGERYKIPVPCSRCPECVKSKINSWAFRINKEMEISSSPLFITLTYNQKSVPRTKSGLKTLSKRDIQLFMKRLRKSYAKQSDKKLRYYIVGEYGSRTYRPHYHAILFNLDNVALVEQAWQNGFVKNYPVLDGGIRYVLKYMSKPRQKRKDDRILEFSLMSKGLGSNYLTNNIINYHLGDIKNCFITLKGGIRMQMPKYYKEKIYDECYRQAVTEYLKERAEHIENQKVKKYKRRHPEKIKLRNLELSKYSQKFDKRIEVL